MSGEKVVADSDTMLFEILSYHLLKLYMYSYLTAVRFVSKTYSSVNLSTGIALVCHLLENHYENILGVTSKKKSLFKDITHIGGWVVKAFSKKI